MARQTPGIHERLQRKKEDMKNPAISDGEKHDVTFSEISLFLKLLMDYKSNLPE